MEEKLDEKDSELKSLKQVYFKLKKSFMKLEREFALSEVNKQALESSFQHSLDSQSQSLALVAKERRELEQCIRRASLLLLKHLPEQESSSPPSAISPHPPDSLRLTQQFELLLTSLVYGLSLNIQCSLSLCLISISFCPFS